MSAIRRAPEWRHFNLAVAVVFLTVAALFPLTRPPLDVAWTDLRFVPLASFFRL